MNILFNYTNKIGYNNNNTDCNCNKSNTKTITKINNNTHSKTSFLKSNLNIKGTKDNFPNIINIFPSMIIKNNKK